ncbi:hypothetical protein [Actinokineospora sp. NPDC004072]
MNIGAVGKIAGAVVADLQSLATASSGQFIVDKDNVLAAAKIISTQVDQLKTRLSDASRDLRVVPPGGDMVSGLVAKEWNERLLFADDSYARRVKDYVVGLENLVVQLQESALAYGYNEEEIAQALGKTSA